MRPTPPRIDITLRVVWMLFSAKRRHGCRREFEQFADGPGELLPWQDCAVLFHAVAVGHGLSCEDWVQAVGQGGGCDSTNALSALPVP